MLNHEKKHKMIEEINRKRLSIISELNSLENINISAKEILASGGKF